MKDECQLNGAAEELSQSARKPHAPTDRDYSASLARLHVSDDDGPSTQNRRDRPMHLSGQPVGSGRQGYLDPNTRGRGAGYPDPSRAGPSLQMFPPPISRTPSAMPPPTSEHYSGRMTPSYSSPFLPEHMRQKPSATIPIPTSRPGSSSQLGYTSYDFRGNLQPPMGGFSNPPQSHHPSSRDTRWPKALGDLNTGKTPTVLHDESDAATPIAISNQPMQNYAKDPATSSKYECEYCGKGFTRPSSLKVHTPM